MYYLSNNINYIYILYRVIYKRKPIYINIYSQKKRRAMYKKTILLPSGSGTIAVMEWIKDNPELALKLDHTFFNETNGFHIGVCSLYAGNTNLESAVSYRFRNIVDRTPYFEYKGMRRTGGEFGVWYFEINNNVYVFTE